MEYIELPASEVRPTYITQRSPEVLYSSESYVPVTYLSAEPVRRVALSPVRSSYIEYVSPGVEIRSSRPGEIRRVGSTIEAPISSYRRALSPVAQSQYHRDISKLFADIKPSTTGSQYHTDIAKLFAGIKQPQPRSTYVDDIGKLFSRFGTAQSKIESARIGELFNRTLLSSEFDDRLKFDVDSAVRRIIEKTKI